MIVVRYLIVRADGSVRITQRPKPANDEVAVKLTIKMPPGWGRVMPGEIAIDMPDVPTIDADNGWRDQADDEEAQREREADESYRAHEIAAGRGDSAA